MTKLLWDSTGSRLYEYGVDRGVYYPRVGAGVPWSGLTSVEETYDQEVSQNYLDGLNFLNSQNQTVFSATIQAFSTPIQFDGAMGIKRPLPFLAVTQQPKESFGMSYRTLIGNDVLGGDYGYKLHILYNVSVDSPSSSYSSRADDVEYESTSYSIRCVPEVVTGKKPTSHVEILSSEAQIGALEDVLYGTTMVQPRLPDLSELYTILGW